MNWIPFKKTKSPSEKKSGDLEALLQAQLRGTGAGTKNKKSNAIGNSYESMSKEGYMNAVAVYYCISLIAQKAGTVPIKLFQKAQRKEDRTEIYSHPILDLMKNPSPIYDWETYLETFLSYYFLDGNVYQRPLVVNNKVKELELYSPMEVAVVYDDNNRLSGYKTTVHGNETFYPIKISDLSCKVKHFKAFNPLNKYEGLSPIQSARTVIDIQTSGDAHNYNMLTNQARPSGALSYKPSDGAPAQMDEEQFTRLKEEIRQQYSGSENIGRPMLLEGGLEWVQMSLNARDLDYINSRGVSQKDICRAFKVPPVLLGLDNDSTYNNVREARLGLWDDAITSVLNRAINHWNKFILPMFQDSEGLELVADYSKVADLETRTERVWKRLNNSDFITLNEKRNAIGYDPIEGGNTTFISSGDMPLSLLNMGIQASNINEIVSAGAQAQQASTTEEPKPVIKPTKNPIDKINPVKSFEQKASNEEIYRMIDGITIQFENKLDKDLIPFMKTYGSIIEKGIVDNQEMGAEFAFIKFSEKLHQILKPHLKNVIVDFGEITLRDVSRKSGGSFLYKEDDVESDRNLVADAIEIEVARRLLSSSAWKARVEQYIEQESLIRARLIEAGARDGVRSIIADGLAKGKSFDVIAKEASAFIGDGARAMTVVRTEIISAREFAGFEAAKMTGVALKKQWLSSVDERVRATHVVANGQIVELHNKFSVGSAYLDHPGDVGASAPRETINCRCHCLYLT